MEDELILEQFATLLLLCALAFVKAAYLHGRAIKLLFGPDGA